MVIPSMSRSTAPLLLSVGLVLAASASPLVAQKTETIARRALRASTSDSSEGRLRRLEQSIDSLVRVFREDELSPEQRFSLRQQIDERFAEFVALRAAASSRPAQGNVFFRPAPNFAFETRFGDASTLLPRVAQGSMVPGWIGIVVGLTPTQIRIDGNELFMRYLLYPEIASVDPSSPAQRAGLVRGDTLVAYNGRDVRREEISMTRLIVPKATVKIRVRRDGKVKELPVVVAEVPERVKKRREEELLATRSAWYSQAPMPPMPPMPTMPRVPPSAIAPTRQRAVSVAPTPRTVPSAPMIAPLPPVFTITGVAGAQLASVSDAMQAKLGLPAGVLVTQVPVGSLAAESGLEEGDLILRVGQEAVTTVREVRELVKRAADDGERSVMLELRRGKARRTLTLRWN